ncbi:class I SAM-dependent methyltransferase [Falsiroseomonas oryziterrae]|uniref:hypothetical protein n=1 Tax=Falsiroseomonas oryziterrae TaxID=2911368 RepID=UPI001F369EBE|nr:hypothetical protein [Roseomonas sp. NPKOSM-4]
MTPVLKRLALGIPPIRRLYESRNLLASQLAAMQAAAATEAGSPFLHYHASFDPIEVIRRHALPDPSPMPGQFTNFLGVRMAPRFLAGLLDGKEGQVEGLPIPANWHADVAEWGAALRAVDLARGSFAVAELGCGWGCWLNNTGVAARRAGLAVTLLGVEGDDGHVAFALEAATTNGFTPEQITIRRGIAAAQSGVALFPRQGRAGAHWGLEPVFGATEAERARAIAAGSHDELPMVSLDELLAPVARLDLLHVDIQGGEADLVDGCLDLLYEKVAYVVIGTHSRQIEGRLMSSLLAAGWRLEIERPAILVMTVDGPLVRVDGVQGWRNPALLPPERG